MFNLHRGLVAASVLAAVTTYPLAAAQPPSCSNATFAIALGNCTFASTVISWGNLVEVGSPPQRVCLIPSTVINSTMVSQKSLCQISNTLQPHKCEALRGGFFNENSSTTWSAVELSSYNDTRSNPTWDHFNPPGFTKVGYDKLGFPNTDDNVVLNGAGIALNQYGNNSNAGMIGLGKDSVFLNDAVHQARSGSKSWSLDAGSNSLVKPRNGELVIGGYNAGRTDGTLAWSNVSNMAGDRPCPLRTRITDMSVTLDNGDIRPIMSSAETVEACIEPYDNKFRFTAGMLLNFKQLTNFNETLLDVYNSQTASHNLSFTELGLPYDSSRVGNWQLSITLDNGYKTTLPAYELHRPLQGFDNLGDPQTVAGITNLQILNVPTGEGEVPTLGKIFLSRSYLAVNYEISEFGLTLAKVDPTEEKYVSFPSKSCSGNSSSLDSNQSSTDNKTPVGAIVGGAVGGLALIVAIAFLIWYFRRRQRRKIEAAQSTINISSPAHFMGHNVDPYMVAQGLGGHQHVNSGQISEIYSEPQPELESPAVTRWGEGDSPTVAVPWESNTSKSPGSAQPGRNNSMMSGSAGSRHGDSPRTAHSDIAPGGWPHSGAGRPLYEVPG